MDFVHDRLADGRPFRLLTLVDNFSRVSPAIECDFSLNGQRVVAVLERLKESGLPKNDQGRQRQRIHLQGARCLGASARCEARVQPARQAH